MWEYNTLEVLQEFVCQPLSIDSIQVFMGYFELNMYGPPDCLRSASNLALVHSEKEYIFSSDDLMWLFCANTVALCKGDGRNLLFVGLNNEDEDYYTASAAIIKLYNIVFPGTNQYIFKTDNGIAFGCKRNLDAHIENNFCVTKLFYFDILNECVFFLEEALFSDEDSLPYIVMQYSPQERGLEYESKKRTEVSLDYIRFLDEVNSIYGIDTTKEYARYVESFVQSQTDKCLTYPDVCSILQYIGEDKKLSSFDILDDALAQEELAKKAISDTISEECDSTEFLTDYSQDALMDAERLLNEMLKRDKQ